MNVTKRPVNLFGSRVAVDNPSLIVLAEELSITTANNESLTLTGQGSIQRIFQEVLKIFLWALYL